jgi:hypothetical protein
MIKVKNQRFAIASKTVFKIYFENYSSTRLFFIVVEHKQQYKSYLDSLASWIGAIFRS